MTNLRCVLLLLVCSLAPKLSDLAAQSRPAADRYELGLRLRAFERQLDRTTDAARRKAAFVELDAAVQAFFGMNLDAVATSVEAAATALHAKVPTDDERFAARLWLHLPQRLVDCEAVSVACELRSLPPPRGDDEFVAPTDAVLVLRVVGHDAELARLAIGELPQTVALPLAGLSAGDLTLQWSVQRGATVLQVREQGISLVTARDQRLKALEQSADATEDRTDLEGHTLMRLVRTLRGMTKDHSEETILPGARLLAEAESLAKLEANARHYAATASGQYWLCVPTEKGAVHVRLCLPANSTAGDLAPLVLALHGAGGSENLFCDGYGDGATVRQCAERGWILCAPRSSGMTGVELPALIDALAERFPVDRDRVVLIGHSMGAMQAIAQATRAPDRFAAVAALGGGGSVRAGAKLERLPFFVGAGERDFGRNGAYSLSQQLAKVEAKTTWREYADVEHLAVVQVALPDVFAFFDRSLEAARAR
jgi:pimeloyl-ACP methyl ester carboxylesterase